MQGPDLKGVGGVVAAADVLAGAEEEAAGGGDAPGAGVDVEGSFSFEDEPEVVVGPAGVAGPAGGAEVAVEGAGFFEGGDGEGGRAVVWHVWKSAKNGEDCPFPCGG